ncbi:uncharacterized protein TNIN_346751 [Trichonephila inaurata madagascariensis]|uniref:Uncharacterized protein n=1 Tax=Trichonephila inaurata madagascariensis TaxID=2747483 RepID=A0A8X6YK61_9ARAC|nr:uncharacterized protein TNIN_346751 [Trichonephila inaurata madagascariensis]
MDISRAPDNGTVRSDHRQPRKDDSGMHKLCNSEPRRYCYTDSSRMADFSNESDMSEVVFSSIRPHEESDFSDTSASLGLSTSTAQRRSNPPNIYREGFCYECTTPSAPDKRRRRKMIARSVVLDDYTKIDPNRMNSGLSDSGILLRNDRNFRGDFDSSSSDCSAAPVKMPRRKPKTHRRSMPPNHCCMGYGNQPPMGYGAPLGYANSPPVVYGNPPPVPPRPHYGNCYPSRPWVSSFCFEIDFGIWFNFRFNLMGKLIMCLLESYALGFS